jgi:hypothetical protein
VRQGKARARFHDLGPELGLPDDEPPRVERRYIELVPGGRLALVWVATWKSAIREVAIDDRSGEVVRERRG